jgi:hypothetical protein
LNMSKQEQKESPAADGLSALELMRIVTIDKAAELAGMSRSTLMRNHADKVIRISAKRRGMRVRDALMIGNKAS